MKTRRTENKEVLISEKISYGIGDFGYNLIYGAMSSFLLFYYTDYVGVSALRVGMIMFISKFVDVLFSIIMGIVIDRTNSKIGKARVWIFRSTIPLALSGILLFSVPMGMSETGKLVYIFISYNLCASILFTMGNVSYSTLNALITKNKAERESLNTIRMFLASMGALLVNGATLPLVRFLGDDNAAWRNAFIVIGIIMTVLFSVTVFGTRERVTEEENRDVISDEGNSKRKSSLSDDLFNMLLDIGYVVKNKYFIMLALCFLLMFICYGFNSGAAVYYAKTIFKNSDLGGIMNTIQSIVQMVFVFISGFFIKKLGKRNTLIISCIVYILGFLSVLLPIGITGVMITSCIIKGMANAGITNCIFAMIPDTIEYGYYKTKHRSAGMINSFTNVSLKIGSGISSALMGAFLTMNNYAENSIIQPPEAVSAIRHMYITAPVIMIICVIIVMIFYRLDKIYDQIA